MINARFCVEVWGTEYSKIKEICLLAEKLGYYGFYYGESLADIDLDCWTLISNLSAITEKIKLGPVITYLFPQCRNISLLAKQALTIQEISKGRLEFRTGAGATLQWASQWWHPYGIEYPNNAERVSLLEEGIQLLCMLWSKPSTTFEGRHLKVKDAALLRKQTQTQNNAIPITIAAKQDKTMAICLQHRYDIPMAGFQKCVFASVRLPEDLTNKSLLDYSHSIGIEAGASCDASQVSSRGLTRGGW